MNNSNSNKIFLNAPILKFSVLLIMALATGFLIPVRTIVEYINVSEEGKRAKQTIIAPFTFDIKKSDKELKHEKEIFKTKVLAVFNYDEKITENSYDKLRTFEKNILTLQNPEIPDSIKKQVQEQLEKKYSSNTINIAKTAKEFLDETRYSFDKIMDAGVTSVYIANDMSDLEQYKQKYHPYNPAYLLYNKDYVTIVRDSMQTTADRSVLLTKEQAIEKERVRFQKKYKLPWAQETISEILYGLVSPNVFYNASETMRLKEVKAADVTLYKGKVIKGSQIVKKDEIINKDILDKLRSLNIAQNRMFSNKNKLWLLRPYLLNIFIATLLMLCFGACLKLFQNSIFTKEQKFFTFIGLFVLTTTIVRISIFVLASFKNIPHHEYAIPFLTGSIIATIIWGLPAGILFNIFISIFSGIMFGYNYQVMLFVLLTGSLTCWVSSKTKTYLHFMFIFIIIFISSGIYLLMFDLVRDEIEITRLILYAEIAAIGSIGAVFLSFFHKPFEKIAHESSNLSLLRYISIDYPLLHRLSTEAPGTFQHSTNVANLASAAAVAIGENPLLAKVLAYYHDIGKISNPSYFSENKRTNDSDSKNKKSPNFLKSIIASHISEGIRLAKEYGLPKPVHNVIMQHHGSTPVFDIISGGQDNRSEEDRVELIYPGPKPQTKLNAIIMLANSIEMAIRAGELATEKDIRSLTSNKMQHIVSEAQLDECNMSFVELNKTTESFIPVLVKIITYMNIPKHTEKRKS